MTLHGGRRKAREILFRVYFETDVTGDDPREVLEYALGRYRLTEEARDYAVRTLEAGVAARAEIDAHLRGGLRDWSLERISTVVRSALRLAVTEFLASDDVDARVAIDEAIELTRKYGEEDAAGFVNGVLDPIARRLRAGEWA